jgi:FMN reductase (NADPH)
MNDVIELLMKHRSIRKFKKEPIPDSAVETILRAAQMASTSSNVQAYSVIAIKDAALRERIMQLSGNQEYIVECPVFLVWCADLHRLCRASAKHAAQGESGQASDHAHFADTVENLIVATVDTALAAQNAVIAAESLGYGVVYIGALRNQIGEVSELLKLPDLVYPVFGMCIGVPDQEPLTRPRLPLDGVLHTDAYQTEKIEAGIEAYDQIYAEYMRERSGGQADTPWSLQMRRKIAAPVRLHMKDFLQSKGFMKR